MRELLKDYLKDIKIESRNDLFDVLNMIAPLLGEWGISDPMSGRKLMRFVPARVRANSYVSFEIPKKSGGKRKISAPVAPLKAIQSVLNIFLQSVFTPSSAATGFIVGKNVKDNAAVHLGQTCIFNTDLENFFPSITKLMVRRALKRELRDIIPSNDAISIICRLCTAPDAEGVEVLPQGAPTSPVLSNIVLKKMDMELLRLAERMNCRYSRYADDITFSHSMQPRKINSRGQTEIIKVIERYGLKINGQKTKTLTPGVRMEVTGVTVSDKLNVPRSYTKQLRTLLHLWEKYGYAMAQEIFARDFNHGVQKELASVINGKINYLEMIKGKDDSTYRSFKNRFKVLLWKEKIHKMYGCI